ncbi:Deoxyguanosine kinase [Candidatus Hepatoplasma crinochetorum Av]|uniref:Deoxyguanosine kinase n=1 Tax=Candidatus Hepatoplasma crinochetorum Av TaxID=1427984 RepID=W8GT15_9MOLU|nr:deoxynucleoside kinase [Candidatus Hepatoplasma crinochetorum]AHK22565.1 Deoxyguanosine kinase [Candidatus Hepatoplasma crinochetorum Av]
MDIIISGTVGVGKSTISKMLYLKFKKDLNLKVNLIKEIADENPYLDFYYKNKEEWSFLTQIDFLRMRFKSVFINNNDDYINIYDRHFLDDYVFSSLSLIKESMSSFNFNIYKRINQELLERINYRKQKIYFFLLISDFETTLLRIKKRGRESEQDLKLNLYWRSLYQKYYQDSEIKNYFKKNSDYFFLINADQAKGKILDDILKIIKKGKYYEDSYQWNNWSWQKHNC